MVTGTEFPRFPTEFTEDEAERLNQLEQQKSQMEQIYQQKFSEQAWAKVPAPEKFLRNLLPTWTRPLVQALPGTAETWDWGYTPEQFRHEQQKVFEEYKELAREEKVTRLLPTILGSMELAYLSGEPITSPSEFVAKVFPSEISQDFTEEEKQFITSYGYAMLRASKEDILSGKLLSEFFEQPVEPLTMTDWTEYFKEQGYVDPRTIHTSVAFTKDLEQIQNVLRTAYAPQTTGMTEEEYDTLLQERESFYRQWAESAGLRPKGESESMEDYINRVNKAMGEEEGQLIFLSDDQDNFIMGSRRSDGSIWVDEVQNGVVKKVLVGYYNEQTGNIDPIGLQGQPLITQEAKESAAKDLWDAWSVASIQAWEGTKNFFTSILPDAFLAISEKAAPYTVIGDKYAKEESVRQIQEWRARLKDNYNKNTAELNQWFTEHPELAPRPEWTDPDAPWTPGRIGYTIVSNAPIAASALIVGAGTSLLTGNPVTGGIAAASLLTPSMTSSLVEDAIANGASFEDATAISTGVGLAMGAVEIAPWTVALKIISPTLMKAFGREVASQATATVVKNLTARGLIGATVKQAGKNFIAIEATEILEEEIQGIMQNAVVKLFNEERSLFEGMSNTAISTFWAVSPLAFMGGSTAFVNMKSQLPKDTQDTMTKMEEELVSGGLEESHAQAITLAKVLETEKGQAEVIAAAEKAEDIASVTNDRKIANKEKKIDSINRDIAEYEAFIAELREEKNVSQIANIQAELDALKRKLTREQDALEKLKTKAQIPAVETVGKKFITFGETRQLSPIHEQVSIMQGEENIGNIKFRGTEVGKPMTELVVDELEITKEQTLDRVLMRDIEANLIKLARERGATRITIVAKKGADGKTHEAMYRRAGYTKTPIGYTKEIGDVRAEEAVEPVSMGINPVNWDALSEEQKLSLAEESGIAKTSAKKTWSELTDVQQEKLMSLTREETTVPGKWQESSLAQEGKVELVPISFLREHENPVMTFDELAEADAAAITRLANNIKKNGLNEPVILHQSDQYVMVGDGSHRVLALEKLGYKEVPAVALREGSLQLTKPSHGIPLLAKEQTTLDEAPLMEEMPGDEVTQPIELETIPRLATWDEELSRKDQALRDNPIITEKRFVPANIKKLQTQAKEEFNRLKAALERAGEDEDAQKEAMDAIKRRAREARIHQNNILASESFDGLDPMDKLLLTASMLPDKSIVLPKRVELMDIQHYMRYLQEQTGLPFHDVFMRCRYDVGASVYSGEQVLQRLNTDPSFRHILNDKAALARVTQHINSKNPRLNVQPITDLTEAEGRLVSTVEDILAHYEPHVRYMRVMNTDSDIESLKEEFPDAVEAGKELELQMALDLKQRGELSNLWSFLKSVSWGTIQGYTPWMKYKASIFPRQLKLGTTRGEARLLRRSSIEFDENLGESLLLDVVRYVKQIENQWRLRPDLKLMEDLWSVAKDKFADGNYVEGQLKRWSGEMQQFGIVGDVALKFLHKLWRQAMSATFMHPYMAFRNSFQAFVLHPDRSELFRYMANPLKGVMAEKAQRYYDVFVHQLGGIKMDFLLAESPGFGVPGLTQLTRLADKVSLYGKSDNIPRALSYKASFSKAWRATQTYLQSERTSKDVDTWIRKSGAIHLTQTERAKALEYLAQADQNMSLAIPGLEQLNGAELACMYIGQEVANMTHFLYARPFRSIIEMENTGKILFNLVVFPRGYAQRLYHQMELAFGEGKTWEQAAASFKDIMLIMMVGAFMSDWLEKITGKPRRAYNPLTILQWTPGGLAIGVGLDLADLVASVFTAIDPTAPEDERKKAIGAIPSKLERNAGVFVPFYRNFVSALEAAMDKEDLTLSRTIKILRSHVDDKYEIEELEDMDRTLWEKIRLAILSSEVPDPDKFTKAKDEILEQIELLGERNYMNDAYNTKDLGNLIDSKMNQFPDDMFILEEGMPEIVEFYATARDRWKPYYELPTHPADIRRKWRESHIEEEAMMIFWGKYTKSVFTLHSKEGKEVYELLNLWSRIYGITPQMMPRVDWAD